MSVCIGEVCAYERLGRQCLCVTGTTTDCRFSRGIYLFGKCLQEKVQSVLQMFICKIKENVPESREKKTCKPDAVGGLAGRDQVSAYT